MAWKKTTINKLCPNIWLVAYQSNTFRNPPTKTNFKFHIHYGVLQQALALLMFRFTRVTFFWVITQEGKNIEPEPGQEVLAADWRGFVEILKEACDCSNFIFTTARARVHSSGCHFWYCTHIYKLVKVSGNQEAAPGWQENRFPCCHFWVSFGVCNSFHSIWWFYTLNSLRWKLRITAQ